MGSGMLARRGVAAPDVTALCAAPQVQPPTAAGQALDAAVSAVEIYQQLAQQLPAAFERNLNAAIRTRTELQQALGHTQDAIIGDG